MGAPQGFKLDINLIVGDGTESSFAAYYTGNVCWLMQRIFLPASFKAYAGPRINRVGASSSARQGVASIRYKGCEGAIGLRSEVEIFSHKGDSTFDNKIPNEVPPKRQLIAIRRKGIGREYALNLWPSGEQLMWKGSKKVLNLVDDDSPRCNGNLKLFSTGQPEKVLAIWKNRTDPRILGSVIIMRDLHDRNVSVEEALWSCLAIVLAERMSARGWLGGLQKHGNNYAF